MDASGKDDILLETVGVGQGEIDVVDHADTVVLALMPGSGDSIQALKAGVMEIPDVIVRQQVPTTRSPSTMIREVKAVLALGPAARLAGAGGAHRGDQGRGDRRAARKRSTPTALTIAEDGDAGRAPGPKPARRGARASPPRGCAASSSSGSEPTPSGPGCSSGSSAARSIRRPRRASCWSAPGRPEPGTSRGRDRSPALSRTLLPPYFLLRSEDRRRHFRVLAEPGAILSIALVALPGIRGARRCHYQPSRHGNRARCCRTPRCLSTWLSSELGIEEQPVVLDVVVRRGCARSADRRSHTTRSRHRCRTPRCGRP